MKTTTFAKSAMALALSMVACASYAATKEAVHEDFAGIADDTAATAIPAAHSNLTWTASGANDASKVTDGKLNVSTEGDTLSAAISDATALNEALTNGNFKSITFSADIAFVPTASAETFAEDASLKFALYAIESAGATNLAVYAKQTAGGAAENITTAIALDETLTPVAVTITNDNVNLMFKVTANGTTAPATGWYYALANNSLNGLNLTGNGEIDNIVFSYEETSGYNAGDASNTESAGKVLTQDGADYLNAIVNAGATKEAVDAALANMTAAELDDAMLLNQNITAASQEYTFEISDIKRTAGGVTVTITLDRGDSEVAGNINGIATLYSCDTPDGEYTSTDEQFTITADGTSTVEFTGSHKFFKVKITGNGATTDAQ